MYRRAFHTPLRRPREGAKAPPSCPPDERAPFLPSHPAPAMTPLLRPSQRPLVRRVALSASMGNALQGCDNAAIAGSLLFLVPSLGLSEHPHTVGAIVSMTPLGALIATLLAGPAADAVGRRPVLVTAAMLFIAGNLLQLCCGVSIPLLLAARCTVGVSTGLVVTLVPLLISECAPSHVRGRLAALPQLTGIVGMAVAYAVLLGISLALRQPSWHLLLSVGSCFCSCSRKCRTVPAVMYLCLLLLAVPESPRWLLQHGRHAEAHDVLRCLHGPEADARELLGRRSISLRQPLLRVWEIPGASGRGKGGPAALGLREDERAMTWPREGPVDGLALWSRSPDLECEAVLAQACDMSAAIPVQAHPQRGSLEEEEAQLCACGVPPPSWLRPSAECVESHGMLPGFGGPAAVSPPFASTSHGYLPPAQDGVGDVPAGGDRHATNELLDERGTKFRAEGGTSLASGGPQESCLIVEEQDSGEEGPGGAASRGRRVQCGGEAEAGGQPWAEDLQWAGRPGLRCFAPGWFSRELVLPEDGGTSLDPPSPSPAAAAYDAAFNAAPAPAPSSVSTGACCIASTHLAELDRSSGQGFPPPSYPVSVPVPSSDEGPHPSPAHDPASTSAKAPASASAGLWQEAARARGVPEAGTGATIEAGLTVERGGSPFDRRLSCRRDFSGSPQAAGIGLPCWPRCASGEPAEAGRRWPWRLPQGPGLLGMGRGSQRVLYERKVLKSLLVSVGLQCLQQACGLAAVLRYLPLLLVDSAQDTDNPGAASGVWALTGGSGGWPLVGPKDGWRPEAEALLAGAFITALMTPFAALSLSLLDSRGRRGLLLATIPFVSAALLCAALSSSLLDSGQWASVVTAASLAAYCCAFIMGLGPIPNIVSAEVAPREVRGLHVSLSVGLNWMCGIAISFFLPRLHADFGAAGLYTIFFFASIVTWLFVFLAVPETRGLALDEVIELFE